jgi:hypothetical protein
MDAGLHTIEDTFSAFGLDDRWSVRSRRGFTWLPYERAQRIWVTDPVPWHRGKVQRVIAETDLFALDQDRGDMSVLSFLGAEATMSGLRYEDGMVKLRCSVLVYDDGQEWVSELFRTAALVQALEAQGRAAAVATAFGHEPFVHTHPTSGLRSKPDPMLKTLTDRAVWAGQHRWGKRDFTSAIEWLGQYGIVAADAPGGLAVEFPFERLRRERARMGSLGRWDGPVNRLRVIKERHPDVGWGVRLKLTLAGWPTTRLGAEILPIELNALDQDSGESGHFIGSWAADRDFGAPYFTTFLPASLYGRGLLEEALTWTEIRSMWAFQYVERQFEESALVGNLR